jgi:hypothetical protein
MTANDEPPFNPFTQVGPIDEKGFLRPGCRPPREYTPSRERFRSNSAERTDNDENPWKTLDLTGFGRPGERVDTNGTTRHDSEDSSRDNWYRGPSRGRGNDRGQAGRRGRSRTLSGETNEPRIQRGRQNLRYIQEEGSGPHGPPRDMTKQRSESSSSRGGYNPFEQFGYGDLASQNPSQSTSPSPSNHARELHAAPQDRYPPATSHRRSTASSHASNDMDYYDPDHDDAHDHRIPLSVPRHQSHYSYAGHPTPNPHTGHHNKSASHSAQPIDSTPSTQASQLRALLANNLNEGNVNEFVPDRARRSHAVAIRAPGEHQRDQEQEQTKNGKDDHGW